MEPLALGVLILLVWPPLAAFLFALAASLFGPSWGEYPYSSEYLVPHVVPRLSVLMAVVAILVVVDVNKVNINVLLFLGFLGLSNATLSMQFIKQTRTQVVEGGPPPPALLAGADNKKMKGKVVVLTGANSGIGKETARQLAAMGATVVMACRSVERAQAARRDCIESIQQRQQQHKDGSSKQRRDKNAIEPKMDILKLDLSSLASVREAAAELDRRYDKIDILINNAGLMMGKQETTVDGHELVMQANHLGHYLLTRLLVDHYQLLGSSSSSTEHQGNDAASSGEAPRILILTSSTYVLADHIDLEDLFCQKGKRSYTLFGQYALSKLANILFANELARRYNNNKRIFVASIHPGLVRTDVVRNMPWYLYYPNIFFAAFIQALQKTPAQGAWNTLYLATATNLSINDDKARSGPDDDSLLVPATASGCYWVNRAIQEKRPCAKDRVGAVQLWEDSAKYVGLTPEEQRPRSKTKKP